MKPRLMRDDVIKVRLGATAAIAILLLAAPGWTQDEIQTAFVPTTQVAQTKFDARMVPAKATTDDEAALVNKGYCKIGTATAVHPGKNASIEITQRLNAAVLVEAAEAGGDVVRFESEGGKAVEIPDKLKTTRTCTGTWVESTTYSHNVAGDEIATTTSTCSKWDVNTETAPGTKVKQVGVVSDGTVWRYDPSLSATLEGNNAEITSAIRSINPYALVRFVGKNINDAELHAWVAKLNATVQQGKGITIYECKPLGIALTFDGDGNLSSIDLYSGIGGYAGTGVNREFRQYQGDLPLGLSFQLSRSAVESRLGPPTVSKYAKFIASYPIAGVVTNHAEGLKVDLWYDNNNIKRIEPDAMLGRVSISCGIP